ncbi:Hydroxyneurosporene synthase (CrtC) [Pedobacter sp. ok626]|uniref:lipocalin-like domain-containing protein n=1 Tax=Pedobacter sp. ok626 TaxID=1761882 RepID=UPI0008889BB3|nr:lipocalin-like domain-containing protein [Pedobacter sp. ok626]SDJ56321.1 Hydroxyneurosporene synthase (CrtC) [Pedobacter sp. ok626]
MAPLSYLATTENDYETLNLKKGVPEQWEDGMRTHGGKGTYEWWYFDTHLADGSKMVIVFYTKALTEVNKPTKAYATLNIDYKDGTKLERYLPSSVFSASKTSCDVKIGANTFKGDLKNYSIHLEDYDFKLDVEFNRVAESWRPETGHFYFGDKQNLFSWFVAVPKGNATVTYSIGQYTVHTSGSCYHDHNWGNKGMHQLINHWYWSRAEFGPYTVIACQIVPEKKYGDIPIDLVYIAKEGKKLADDPAKLKLHRSYPIKVTTGNKPISNELIFNYENSEFNLSLQLTRKTNIIETYLIQQDFQRKLAKIFLGFNGAYFRIAGDAKLEVNYKDGPSETFENDHAIWELMYFGDPF